MPGWAVPVYATDRAAAEVCTRMSEAGFGFDVARAKAFAVNLKQQELDCLARVDKAAGRVIKRGKSGGPSSKDLQTLFFKDLKARVVYRSELTRKPSLGVDAMREYAASPRDEIATIALALLEWRRARKVRATYIESILAGTAKRDRFLGDDGRVHPTWMNYGAVSGRWSCQGPNLMNLPRAANDPTAVATLSDSGKILGFSEGIRTLYVPRENHVIVTFDAKQLEMRIAAYASGDEKMIAACESQDLHAANASVIFGDEFVNGESAVKKIMRDLAKSAGFAVCYLAEAETVYARLVASGVKVSMRKVEKMLAKLRDGFAGYFGWQANNLNKIIRLGYVESPILGRRRWLGHEPSPTEAANFPIQSGAADLMNIRLPKIISALDLKRSGTKIVAQVHDAGVFEVPRSEVEMVKTTIVEIFTAPIVIASSGKKLTASFPVDVEVSERWH